MWQCCDSTSLTGETNRQITKVLDVSECMTMHEGHHLQRHSLGWEDAGFGGAVTVRQF